MLILRQRKPVDKKPDFYAIIDALAVRTTKMDEQEQGVPAEGTEVAPEAPAEVAPEGEAAPEAPATESDAPEAAPADGEPG